MKWCSDLHKLIEFDCCSSCHLESDELGRSMSFLEIEQEEYEVCCSGVKEYEKQAKE